jgi:AraC family transcriptional activator of tynA and feaB
LLRSLCGRYNPEGIDPKTFAGWVRPVNVCGFTALNIACNAGRVERTYRDVRLMARIITSQSFSSLANQQ